MSTQPSPRRPHALPLPLCEALEHAVGHLIAKANAPVHLLMGPVGPRGGIAVLLSTDARLPQAALDDVVGCWSDAAVPEGSVTAALRERWSRL